jgi:hypothetical protein
VPLAVLEADEFAATIALGEPSLAQQAIATRALVLAATLLSEAGVAAIVDGTAPPPEGIPLARETIRHFAHVELGPRTTVEDVMGLVQRLTRSARS